MSRDIHLYLGGSSVWDEKSSIFVLRVTRAKADDPTPQVWSHSNVSVGAHAAENLHLVFIVHGSTM